MVTNYTNSFILKQLKLINIFFKCVTPYRNAIKKMRVDKSIIKR